MQLNGDYNSAVNSTIILLKVANQWKEYARSNNAANVTYTPTNITTDRSWDANAAVNGTGIDVADAGPANVALLSDHDALVAVVQELSDIVATMVVDLQAKGTFQ